MNLQIDDRLEKESRMFAAEEFEANKGFLKKAIEGAIKGWVNKN